MKIGILALQGAFIEHNRILENLGAEPVHVRLPRHLEGLGGLIIPGGESTTIARLALFSGLMEPLRNFAMEKPVWGICAGMIFMAKRTGSIQPTLEVINITVERNAFGRQIDSFTTHIFVPVLPEGMSKPFRAVFIRAPRLVETQGEARIIAELPEREAVAAIEGKCLVTSFHPELTSDSRFHRFFLNMAL